MHNFFKKYFSCAKTPDLSSTQTNHRHCGTDTRSKTAAGQAEPLVTTDGAVNRLLTSLRPFRQKTQMALLRLASTQRGLTHESFHSKQQTTESGTQMARLPNISKKGASL